MRHNLTLVEGDLTLRPLMENDVHALIAITAATSEEWTFMGSQPTTPVYFQTALDAPDHIPFTVEMDGQIVGSTRFYLTSSSNRTAEIGWSFLARHLHGSGVNRRIKRLLLTHAFEALWEGRGCLRVEFHTDARNVRSQRAVERLGAVREGVLRRHHVMTDGFVRDTVIYSITDQDWPTVKVQLETHCQAN